MISKGGIAVNAGQRSSGTQITLTDQEGNMILNYTPELSFNVVILSCPDMISGEIYTITVGSDSAEFEAS